MKLILKIALRYLVSAKGSTLLITGIAIAGVVLGVLAIVLTLGVFTGFQDQLREKLLFTSPHIIITSVGDSDLSSIQLRISGIEEVERIIPFTLYNAMLSKGDNVQPVTVKGVNFMDKDFRSLVESYMTKGDINGLVVGKGISEVLGLKPGDAVLLVSLFGIRTPTGIVPKTREASVGGIFYTGSYDKDFVLVFMDKREASKFFKRGIKLEGIEVYIRDPYMAQVVKEKIRRKLDKDFVIVRSWIDLNRSLFNALQLEKLALFIILFLMVLVASFNITSLLFVKSKEKIKDIAILKTYGMSVQDIRKIFFAVGVSIGIVGAVMGVLISYAVAFFVNRYKLIRVPEEVYMMSHIPINIEISDVLLTVVGTTLLSFLSSLLPALKASSEKVVDVLRGE
jgi:lipoprotein-releasing system permease protein